jgi:hypothetical protein
MIITLCGSAKFEAEWVQWNKDLTLAGHIVLGLSVYPSQMGDNKDWYSPEQKIMLDIMHRRKIDISDAIVVLNKGGYVGESTTAEIRWAEIHGKDVFRIQAYGGLDATSLLIPRKQ